MCYTNSQKGFTLIELLVVIAIIGVLASVVLASLNSTRTKARDVAMKSEAIEFSKLLNLHYLDTPNYSALQKGWNRCNNFTGNYATQAQKVCESILDKTNGTTNDFYTGINTGAGFSYDRNFSVMVRLTNNEFFCVGSSGGKYEGPINSWSGSGCYSNP